MSREITLTTIKAGSDNRVLEKDKGGYYLVTLGALNVFNSANEFYTADKVLDLFQNPTSVFQRRLKSGYLKGETGHPKFQPGMRREDFYARNMRIEETNTCVHIREVIITETDIDSGFGDGSKVTLIKGWVKPSGPKGDALQKDLDNPEVNVAFSIRSFTNNSEVNGITVKRIVQTVTWDWVTEPGIAYASKWKTLGVESHDVMSLAIEDLSDGEEISMCFNCSLESKDERDIMHEIIANANACNPAKSGTVLDEW